MRNKAALLTEIQRQTRKGGGLSVRTLKESWKEAPQAIEELEKDGEVYVTRTLKDGQMRMVFWNEVKPNEEQGGMAVDKGACGCARGVHRLTRRRVQRALAWPRGSQRCRPLEGTRVRWASGHRCCICRAQGWRCEEEGQEIGAEAEADSPYEHASEGYDRPLARLCCPGVDVQVRRVRFLLWLRTVYIYAGTYYTLCTLD